MRPLCADANHDFVIGAAASLAVGIGFTAAIYWIGLSLAAWLLFGLPGGYGRAGAFLFGGGRELRSISLVALAIATVVAWFRVGPFDEPERDDHKEDPILHPAPARLTEEEPIGFAWRDQVGYLYTSGPRQVMEAIVQWRDRIAPSAARRRRAATLVLAIGRSGVPASTLPRDQATITAVRDLWRLRLVRSEARHGTPVLELTERGRALLEGTAA